MKNRGYRPSGIGRPGNLFSTPEGLFSLLLSASYSVAFVFFHSVVEFAAGYNVAIGSEYRLAFLLMPPALLTAFLYLDMSAKGPVDRVLTAGGQLIVASLPLYRILQ